MRTSLAASLASTAALSALPVWAQSPAAPRSAASAAGAAASQPAVRNRPPNIILILTDDSGYGDFGCYGATRVRTPNIDRLAAQGARFTSAYCPAATCTPTRYSLLTGEYPWRKRGTGILEGDVPLIIEPGRATLPSVLRDAGYATGAIGKWHLGLGDGRAPVNFNGEIKPGPLEVGFDYFFGMPATTDRVPCVFIENRRVVNLDPADPIAVSYRHKIGHEPTGRENPELMTRVRSAQGHDGTIVNGIGRIGWMSGGRAARWKDERMARDFTGKACAFIERNRARPFFLYFATHEPHVPRWPDDRFRGRNEAGIRAESLEEMDWCVGEVMAALDRLGLADNTLIMVTSDNGPAPADGYADGAAENEARVGHRAAGPFRGGKYTPFEGGVREPFVARWPARIKPGAVSSELLCLTDLLATAAAIVDRPLGPGDGVDSLNVLDALTGAGKSPRANLIVSRGNPEPEAIIANDSWKLVFPGGRKPGKTGARAAGGQLYNLRDDPGEARDVVEQHPDIARRLLDLFDAQVAAGFTRPGARNLREPDAARAGSAGRTAVALGAPAFESDL